jgi:hypothetical protein
VAVASRSIRASGFNFKGVLFTGLALALIVGLFFIPEIIELQKSSTSSAKSSSSMKTLSTAAVSAPKEARESQLSKIANLIDSGYLERISSPKLAENAKLAELNTETQTKAQKAESGKAAVAESGLTWKMLRSRESREALKRSHKECSAIIKSLSSNQSRSRLALLNFSNALVQIIEGNNEKTVTALETLKALEGLHATVVREMLRDVVGRTAYRRFMTLDFGPVVSGWSLRLSGQLVPFNPQLTLSMVSLSQKSVGRQSGGYASPLMTSFEGFVIGDDVQRIELVTGGIRLDDLEIRKSDQNGIRRFKSKKFELKGRVLFKVFDNKGRVFEKLYSFYPRARIFENRKGRFVIPKAASEFDSRLDRFFTVGVSKPGEMSEAHLLSQGFEKF